MEVPSFIVVSTYEIEFEYITKRKNKKSLVIEIDSALETDPELWFWKWIKNNNENNKDKPYNDVKIIRKEEINRNTYCKTSKTTFTINQVLD